MLASLAKGSGSRPGQKPLDKGGRAILFISSVAAMAKKITCYVSRLVSFSETLGG